MAKKTKNGTNQNTDETKDNFDASETKDVFDALPEEVQELLFKTAMESTSEEEFLSKIFIVPCPQCGSENTRDFSDTPLDDPTIGNSLECNYIWCLVCGYALSKEQKGCGHWSICAECDSIDEDKEECAIEEYRMEPYLCPTIEKWKERGD